MPHLRVVLVFSAHTKGSDIQTFEDLPFSRVYSKVSQLLSGNGRSNAPWPARAFGGDTDASGWASTAR